MRRPRAPWLAVAAKQTVRPGRHSQWLVAWLLVNARDYQAASDLLDKVLQSQPGSIAQSLKGRNRSAPGRLDAAEQRARQVAPKTNERRAGAEPLGQVAWSGRCHASRSKRCARPTPPRPPARLLLRLYAAQLNPTRDPGPQLAMLEQWLAKRPDDAVGATRRRVARHVSAPAPSARDHYDRLLKQTGSNAVRNNLAPRCCCVLKDPRALALANEAVAREPNKPQCARHRWLAHAEADQLDRALALLRDAACQPGAANIRYHLLPCWHKGQAGRSTRGLRAAMPEGSSPTAGCRSLCWARSRPVDRSGLA